MTLHNETDIFDLHVSKLIGSMYDAVIDPDRMLDELVPKWDASVVEKLTLGDNEAFVAALNKAEILDHITRASTILEMTPTKPGTASLKEFTNEQHCAALVADHMGVLLQVNSTAETLTGFKAGDNLYNSSLYNDTAQDLKSALGELQKPGIEAGHKLVVRGFRADTQAVVLFVLEHLPKEQHPPHTTKAPVLIRATEIIWNQDAEKLLQKGFTLTDVEIELIRFFNAGKTTNEIAEIRGRAVETVRTQIKTLLQKTGVKSQIELLRLVMSLLQISAFAQSKIPEIKKTWASATSFREVSTMQLPDGRQIEYVDQGARNGQPVLMIQPTATPYLPRKTVNLLAAQGLRIVSPVRPGSGKTTDVSKKHGKDKIAADYAHLLNHLNWQQSTIVGQCTGSVYALRIADLHTGKFNGLMMINSGAPFENLAKFNTMPIHSRRSFITARLFSPALYLPHKIAARQFNARPEVRDKLIQFFYADHECDLEALQNSDIYDIATENMRYSLENPARACDDLGRKVQDWSLEALRVADSMPIHLLQGKEHKEFIAEDTLAFAQKHPNIFTTTQKGTAKLVIYAHPEIFVETLAEMAFK